ncbi:MAG: hypothetical protein L3J07_02370 [Candidatus Magasanikbacteria bacterium]|nr:hypothetical protein [Candidatus Magasanikbacteria bacterium]
MWIAIIQKLIIDFLLDFLYFPVWWFTKGLQQILIFSYNLVGQANLRLAPLLWFKNLFVPMFGQYDLQGRIMSFFMRLVNGVVRGFLVIGWIWIVGVFVLFWISFPSVLLVVFISSIGLL